MKWTRDGVVRLGPAYLKLSLCTAAVLLSGCSKSDSSPTAVTIDDLKYPGSLSIQDQGGGKVLLSWTAANNEKNFVGFNIYGIKATQTTDADSGDSHSDLGVTEGQAIQVLGDDNKPSGAAIALINKFDFDPSAKNPFETAGTPPAATTAKATDASGKTTTEAPAISARPISTLGSDGKPIYPTCQVSGTKCSLTAQANAANPTPANGTVTFDLSTLADKKGLLTVGETYCFFVLSTMKGGSQVSAVTSSVACVTPENETTFSYTLPAATANNQAFDMIGWLGTCSGGTCADPTAAGSTYFSAAGIQHPKNSDLGSLFFEAGSSISTMVAGKYNGILDLGYYADGFADATLPASAPAFSLATTGTLNGGGYSYAGQSVPILAQHVYVIATASATATTAPTQWYYNWIYISSDTSSVALGQKATFVVRLPAAAQ